MERSESCSGDNHRSEADGWTGLLYQHKDEFLHYVRRKNIPISREEAEEVFHDCLAWLIKNREFDFDRRDTAFAYGWTRLKGILFDLLRRRTPLSRNQRSGVEIVERERRKVGDLGEALSALHLTHEDWGKLFLPSRPEFVPDSESEAKVHSVDRETAEKGLLLRELRSRMEQLVYRFLKDMDCREALIYFLYDWYNWTEEKIAALLGVTGSRISQLIPRIRSRYQSRLKQLFREFGIDAEDEVHELKLLDDPEFCSSVWGILEEKVQNQPDEGLKHRFQILQTSLKASSLAVMEGLEDTTLEAPTILADGYEALLNSVLEGGQS